MVSPLRAVLIDRLVVTLGSRLQELPLVPAPLVRRGSQRPERRGSPAGILVADQQTSPSAPAAHGERPAAPPPTRAPGEGQVSLPRLRQEVSRLLQGQTPYRVSLPRSGGVLLEGVSADTLPGRLGLQDGDLILTADGVNLRSRSAALSCYLSLGPGRNVDLVYLRNGEQRRLRLALVDRAPL